MPPDLDQDARKVLETLRKHARPPRGGQRNYRGYPLLDARTLADFSGLPTERLVNVVALLAELEYVGADYASPQPSYPFGTVLLTAKGRAQVEAAERGISQEHAASQFPTWAPKAGLTFAAATFLVFIGLVIWSLSHPIPQGAKFPIVSVLALGLAFAFAFVGGDAAAKGKLPVPFLNEHPVEISVAGGVAVFVIVFLLGMLLYPSAN